MKFGTQLLVALAYLLVAPTAMRLRLPYHLDYSNLNNIKTVGEWNGKIAFVETQLLKPLHWKKPKKIFVCSMSDLFHESILDAWRDRIFAIMALCPQHTFQVLTKRPENALAYFAKNPWSRIAEHVYSIDKSLELLDELCAMTKLDYLKNIWFGVTTENQAMADKRIPLLMQISALVRWLSVEPLLEKVDIGEFLQHSPNSKLWLVVGGESGKNYRQMSLDWLNDITSSCIKAGVPFFIKQDSSYLSGKQGRISDAAWSFKQFPY